MGRIRILSDAVANKIAAGEVVERPASVVKELLENSLDAGATEIRVEVESGGRRLIRVADDGSGMLRDDALLAFERHATSKLSDVKDLLAIATLGFRGEALPSIASVSRLVLETRADAEQTGARVEIAGGKILRCDEVALPRGTTITVRDLFYNVPARKKFLRSDQTELAHIGSLVTHYSLAHSDKTFSLRHGAVDLLHVTPVDEMRDRVFQVFGGRIMDDLVDLGAQERVLRLAPPAFDSQEEPEDDLTRVFLLRGFVSRPQVQKLNRNSIFLFVNGRLIRDRLLLHALSSAYHNLMPAACYPFALLFLDCDAQEVDVNVHPSKTEVRFRHAGFVHDFVRDAIRGRLVESRPSASLPPPSPVLRAETEQPAARLPWSEFSRKVEEPPWPAPPSEHATPQISYARAVAPELSPVDDVEDLPQVTIHQPSVRTDDVTRLVPMPIPDTHGGFPDGLADSGPVNLSSLSDLRPLGQIQASFIVAAGRDGLWIIDQHVAHERILFEKVLKQRAQGKVERQQLLMPVLIELSPAQTVEYARIADELNSCGFDTELFGARTISVKATPAGLALTEIDKLMFEVLEIAERELRRTSIGDVRRALAASIACRAAIKINTRLDQSKMEWLLTALAATDCPMSCPHGRPIALRYSTRDILKGFHRI